MRPIFCVFILGLVVSGCKKESLSEVSELNETGLEYDLVGESKAGMQLPTFVMPTFEAPLSKKPQVAKLPKKARLKKVAKAAAGSAIQVPAPSPGPMKSAIATSTTSTSSGASSASNLAVVATIDSIAPPKKQSAFSMAANLGLDSNMRDAADPSYKATASLELTPSIRVSSKAALKAIIALEQKDHGNQETSVTNTQLVLARDPIDLNVDRALNLSAFAIVPTNETDRNDNSLRGGAGLSVGVTQKTGLFQQTATFTYALSLLKNVHQFERTNVADANVSHRARHTVTYNQPINKKWAVELTGRYQTGWTYQDALRTTFVLAQELQYAMNDQISMYLGHSNDGDALGANGIDSNVRLYDELQSHFSTGIVATY